MLVSTRPDRRRMLYDRWIEWMSRHREWLYLINRRVLLPTFFFFLPKNGNRLTFRNVLFFILLLEYRPFHNSQNHQEVPVKSFGCRQQWSSLSETFPLSGKPRRNCTHSKRTFTSLATTYVFSPLVFFFFFLRSFSGFYVNFTEITCRFLLLIRHFLLLLFRKFCFYFRFLQRRKYVCLCLDALLKEALRVGRSRAFHHVFRDYKNLL